MYSGLLSNVCSTSTGSKILCPTDFYITTTTVSQTLDRLELKQSVLHWF